MSRRLVTRCVSRSASTSIIFTKSWVWSGAQSTSCESRLVAAALIAASGVRRSCETAASSAVRRLLPSSSSTADAAWASSSGALLGELELGDERAEQPAVVGAEHRAGQDEHRPLRQLGRDLCVVGSGRHGRAGDCDGSPAVAVGLEYGDGVEGERAAQLGYETREWLGRGEDRTAGEPCEGFGFCLRTGDLRAASGEPIDERADNGGDRPEYHERRDLARLGHAEGVERHGEVEVAERERDDGGDDRRCEPTDDGHDHDAEEQDQQRAGKCQRRPEQGQHERESRDADGAEGPAGRIGADAGAR